MAGMGNAMMPMQSQPQMMQQMTPQQQQMMMLQMQQQQAMGQMMWGTQPAMQPPMGGMGMQQPGMMPGTAPAMMAAQNNPMNPMMPNPGELIHNYFSFI